MTFYKSENICYQLLRKNHFSLELEQMGTGSKLEEQ